MKHQNGADPLPHCYRTQLLHLWEETTRRSGLECVLQQLVLEVQIACSEFGELLWPAPAKGRI